MFNVTPPFGAVHSSPEMMLISLFFVRAGTWWSPRSSTFAVIMLMPLTNWIRLVYREAYPAGLGRARLRLRLQVCMHMPILYTEFPSRNNLPPTTGRDDGPKRFPGCYQSDSHYIIFSPSRAGIVLLLPASGGIGTDVTAKWSKKLERKLNRTGEDNFSFHWLTLLISEQLRV